MKEVKCETCGRPKLLVCCYNTEQTKYAVECPICGNRETIDETADVKGE